MIDPHLHQHLSDMLRNGIRRQVFSGASVAIVDNDGNTSYVDEGTFTYQSDIPFTHSSFVDIASITKLLTSLAFHRYAQTHPDGLDVLHTPITDFLPDIHTSTSDEPITIADLLEMRVEWKTHKTLSAVAIDMIDTHSQLDSKEALRTYILNTPVATLKNQAGNYQDASYIVLGLILEKLFPGQTYHEILSEDVLRPLKMINTTVAPIKERTVPSSYQDGSFLQGIPHDPKARLLHGHAGFFSTGADLAKLAYMLQQKGVDADGDVFIQPETFEALTTPRSLDVKRGWWCRGIRRYQGSDQPPLPEDDLWFGAHANLRTLGVSGFTAQALTVFDSYSIIMLTNYHVPAHPSDSSADKSFPGEIQPLRMRVLDTISKSVLSSS